MIKTRFITLVLTLCLLVSLAAMADSRPFSAEDLVRFERVSDPQLAPDGHHVAYALRQTDMEGDRGVMSLWLQTMDGQSEPTRLDLGELAGHSPRWSADGKDLFFLASREGSSQVWRYRLDDAETSPVTDLPLDVGSFVPAPDGKTLAISLSVFTDCDSLDCTRERLDAMQASPATGVLHERLFVRHWDRWKDGRRAQLFVVDLDDNIAATGEPRWISRGLDADIPSVPFGGGHELSFSPDGHKLVFAARIAGSNEPWSTNFDLYLAPVDASRPPENLTTDNLASDTHPLFSPDGRLLVWKAMRRPGFESDRYRILVRNLADGETREVAPDWDRSAYSLAFSADGSRLYANADHIGQRLLFSIDIANGQVTTIEDHGAVGSISVAGEHIVYVRDDLKTPAQLFARPSGGGPARQLTDHNSEALAGLRLGDYEQFSFPGWNDHTVYGYVVKPVDFQEGQSYPIAFIIHGGPQGSMGEGFHYRWNPQTYAGEGMAVVFIDFHGSTGYGQEFVDSISGDWGGKPLVDLQKGLAWAVDHYDFLDGDRVCALGASYGGYMINWIAGQWPDRFRCLINHAGIFDHRSMYYVTEELWFVEWEHGGTYFDNPEGHERHNPANHVDQWKTPMLVIHGALDFRVPLEQGLGTFTALQRRGIPSELLYFPDENHWIHRPHNSLLWHHHVNRWLRTWLAIAGHSS